MNRREKILAGVIVLLLFGWAVSSGWSKIGGMFEARHTELHSLRSEHRKAQHQVKVGREAEERLEEWRVTSLPSDSQQARKLYQQWLRHKLEEADFDDVDMNTNSGRGRQSAYEQLTFNVSGNGTLDQLTSFMHHFYQAGTLHKIRTLSIRPKKSSDQLELRFSIDALILPGAKLTDSLNTTPSNRLAHGDVESYRGTIVSRNVFAEHSPTPPAQVEEQAASGPLLSDLAKNAYVTAIVNKPGGLRVWVQVRTTGEQFLLGEGDVVELGEFRATVTTILPRQIVLTTEGGQLSVGLGENLQQAKELPSEGS